MPTRTGHCALKSTRCRSLGKTRLTSKPSTHSNLALCKPDSLSFATQVIPRAKRSRRLWLRRLVDQRLSVSTIRPHGAPQRALQHQPENLALFTKRAGNGRQGLDAGCSSDVQSADRPPVTTRLQFPGHAFVHSSSITSTRVQELGRTGIGEQP